MSMMARIENYWNAQPCNVRHGTAPVGTPEWSAQVTARKYFVEPHIPGFAQFERWRGKRVLEIGGGIGTDTLEFGKAGVSVIDSVDLSGVSIILAAERVRQAGLMNVRLSHANAEDSLPPYLYFYDLIYSFGVLHHTPNSCRVLRGAHARLKLDGELRIMLYARWSIKNLLGWQPEAQADCPLVRRYTPRQARALLEAAGFEVMSIRKTYIFPYRLTEYLEHRYVKRWVYRVMPIPVYRILEKLLGDHLLIVARRRESTCG